MPELEIMHLSESGLKNQRFSHKTTGEIVTEIPLLSIGDYEKYDGPGCYYSAAGNVVIDLVSEDTGLTLYGKKSRGDILAQYPDAELITIDEAATRHQKPFIEPVTEITEEKYMYWLEVLFPEDWQHSGGESFKLVEKTCGSITTICAHVRGRYFYMADDYKTPHREIVARCIAFIEAEA